MKRQLIIVGLGEALWDLLPGGKALGGATLNVACHAHQLLHRKGGQGIVASRIGADQLGREIQSALAQRGMSVDHLQRDAEHATGTVNVELNQGQPTFEIVPNVAWDFMEFTSSWEALAKEASAVCFGTLAQRSLKSRETIGRFLDAAPSALRLLDVNLRQQFYDRAVLDESCRRATIVKLNEDELPVVADLLSLPAGAPIERLAQLRAAYDLEAVVYTRGKQGTLLVTSDQVISPPAFGYPAAPDADAVGAGDACSAGILVGWLCGMPMAETALLANHLGAYVASQPGGTPQLPAEIIHLVG